jgi:hypothetical protein
MQCKAFSGQLKGLCSGQVKGEELGACSRYIVEELQGAIRDSSASLQYVETQLEKAKAILLEHEADYLLRQSTVEQVDKVALKKVTEVSPKSSARHARVTEYHRALYIRACWWSSDLSQAS